jgi:serine/threonine protein kinase
MLERPASNVEDEEFLDRVFERVVAAREDGTAVPTAEELLDGREHLRARLEELQRIARTVTRSRADEFPVVPGYTVLTELGRGGMGAVYLARQDKVGGRRVALKVLPATAYLSARARERFLVEARAIAHLSHPHVVTVHDVVAAEGICAYAMEWVQGASLAQIIDLLEARRQDAGDLEPALAHVRPYLGDFERSGDSYPIFVCRIGIAVARALGELHRAGLVHRDVKPSNILLRRDGTPLLSDFGLVHAVDESLTHSGFAGTTTYASPEQLAGDPDSLDARSDVYSLGVTLYRALALRLPFEDRRSRTGSSRTPAGMLRLIESGRSVPLRARNRRLPRDLETIVGKAVEVEPGRRYGSADELADDLERMLSLQPIHARPSGPLTRALKFLRRHRAPTLGVAAGSTVSLALALAAMVYVFLVPRWVETSVREARLALMDPLQANLLFNVVYWGQRWQDSDGSPVPEHRGTCTMRASCTRADAWRTPSISTCWLLPLCAARSCARNTPGSWKRGGRSSGRRNARGASARASDARPGIHAPWSRACATTPEARSRKSRGRRSPLALWRASDSRNWRASSTSRTARTGTGSWNTRRCSCAWSGGRWGVRGSPRSGASCASSLPRTSARASTPRTSTTRQRQRS